MDPYADETLRFVGRATRLRTCRAICADIDARGPATAAAIARRLGYSDSGTVLRCTTKMHQAGWVRVDKDGTVHLALDADPLPRDL